MTALSGGARPSLSKGRKSLFAAAAIAGKVAAAGSRLKSAAKDKSPGKAGEQVRESNEFNLMYMSPNLREAKKAK